MRKLIYQKVRPDAFIPAKAYSGDACWDLRSVEDVVLSAGETISVDTGLRFEILYGEKLHIYSKSGLALNASIHVLNAPGVIDSSYRGTLKVILHNSSKNDYFLNKGSKIAQFSRELVLDDELVEGVVDTETERGENGFGSSGI